MSIVTMPPDLYIGEYSLEQISFDMIENSDPSGDQAVRLFGPPRWKVSMSASAYLNLEAAGKWEMMALQLRRGVNVLGVWDPLRLYPRGTMRGTLSLNVSAAAGDTQIVLAGAVGTLKQGDWLQIGTGVSTSQLVKVMDDVTAVGTLAAVTFEPALRVAHASATAVTWDRPVFYAKSVGKSTKWQYYAGNSLETGFALELLETFQ